MQTKTNPTKTVLTITVGFIAVYLITRWKWAISVSLIIGLTGVFSVYLSRKIEFVWMKLSWILSLIVPNILMGAIFYLFLFPISVFSRLFGKKDPLNLKDNSGSHFKNKEKGFDKESFEKPW
jgi:hypothetical protein